MLRNKLVRSDGSIIDSSVIISCEFTEEVNSNTNLSVGDATASELSVEILNTVNVKQDDVLTYYIIEDGVETKIGVFNVEKPTVASRTSMKVSASDNIVKTEKNFAGWLRENNGLFPMTLSALVSYACSYCGVTLATTVFPDMGQSVKAFYGDEITCRQVLSWAAAIVGRFIRANADGEIEFAWYRDVRNITIFPNQVDASAASISVTDDGNGNLTIQSDDITVIDDGAGNVTLESNDLTMLTGETGVTLAASSTIPYLQGSLSYENYSTDLIKRVQINHSEDDIGVIYPESADGNCFTVSENMILGTFESAVVTQVATNLYAQLKDITYVPFSVTVPRSIKVRAGDIISVMDSKNNAFTSYVMKVSVTPSGTNITSTGDKSYESNVAVSSERFSNLTGKILSIKKSVDGLLIKNADLEGNVSSLMQTTEGLDVFVGNKIKEAIDGIDIAAGVRLVLTDTGLELKFSELNGDVGDLSEEVRQKFEELASNIRFDDGNIILGRASSDIQLVLKNNRVSFVKNVDGRPELAYISDDILYITDGEFLNKLRIGKFGFTPGAGGNLSFKKEVL